MHATPLAVIADVHGNAWALEAVLADIARRGVTQIVNLGDNANGPLDPALSVALLRGSGAIHVRGNGDRLTGAGGPNVRGSAKFAHEKLNADDLQWLHSLPTITHGEGWAAFHARPDHDEKYLVETVVAGKTVLAKPGEIATRLGKTLEGVSLLLCGHTHMPRLVRLADDRLVLNPGSVGLPAYDDDQPVPHIVENGTPEARYAIVQRDPRGWVVDFIALPYDWHAAAAAARAAGWEAWARNLETGFAHV